MLNEGSRLYREQIRDAINKIELSTGGLPDSAIENYEVKWIAERGWKIIGEGFYILAHFAPGLVIEHSKSMIGIRNKIAHEYDVVDHSILYAVVTRHLPLFKEEVEPILAS